MRRRLPPSLYAACARARRSLSSGVSVGVLHVYRLEPAEPAPGQRLRYLFPSEGGAPSAAQLAEAAERGEAVLMPASALTSSGLLGGDAHTQQLGPAGAPAAPLLGEESGAGSASALEAASSAPTDALAIAESAAPLLDVLRASGAAEEPDWRSTVELARPTDAEAGPTDAQMAVLSAAARGDAVALAAALDACPASELARAAQPASGAGALHLAATSGAVEAVRLLIERGQSVHSAAANGSTPLHWAAGSGHADVVRLLLTAGAGTRARSSTWRSTVRGNDSGQLPAHWAAASGHTEVLELLLHHDPTALLMQDERQMVPAAVAARDGHPWLHDALGRLERERVVCVRVTRDATVQRVFSGTEGGAGADEPSRAAIE
jgi:hypothetical protein